MLAFCHLLNDSSGSPVVLCAAIDALTSETESGILFVGSQGRGVLDELEIECRRYWYRRSRYRMLTLLTFAASQIELYRSLSRERLTEETIVYVNTLLPVGAAVWAAHNGHPLIVHIHEVSVSPKWFRWFLVSIVKRYADLVIYVSDDCRSRLPVPGVRAITIANPVSKRIAIIAEFTQYYPRRSGYFNVLMLASPRDFKGIPEFLSLARHFIRRGDIRFDLVVNAEIDEVKNYFSYKDLPPNVELHSRTSTPEDYYCLADLVVNLSRVDKYIETFGLTLVEAMSFGIPVVGPPVGGPSEIVRNGVDGFLIDSRHCDELIAVVTRFADEPLLALSFSVNARNRAKHYSFDAFAARLRFEIAQVHHV